MLENLSELQCSSVDVLTVNSQVVLLPESEGAARVIYEVCQAGIGEKRPPFMYRSS